MKQILLWKKHKTIRPNLTIHLHTQSRSHQYFKVFVFFFFSKAKNFNPFVFHFQRRQLDSFNNALLLSCIQILLDKQKKNQKQQGGAWWYTYLVAESKRVCVLQLESVKVFDAVLQEHTKKELLLLLLLFNKHKFFVLAQAGCNLNIGF